MDCEIDMAIVKEGIEAERLEILHKRFVALWHRCVKPGLPDDAEASWKDLRDRYGEPHRRYHNLCHVYYCLRQIDLAASLMDDPDAGEMSIWYHDVIYEPRAKDNEKRSAGLFAWYGVDRFADEFVSNVRHLILATEHPEVVTSGDACYITDVDLSSFALPWEDFHRDNEHLREEQTDLSDTTYYAGKKRFLINLAARPRIFRTDFFHDLYEEQARNNIQRYLAELHSRTDR